MAVKRRVIWLTDDEWSLLGRRAAQRGESISTLIRVLSGADLAHDASPPSANDRRLLGERAFAEFRPVPKPGKHQ